MTSDPTDTESHAHALRIRFPYDDPESLESNEEITIVKRDSESVTVEAELDQESYEWFSANSELVGELFPSAIALMCLREGVDVDPDDVSIEEIR